MNNPLVSIIVPFYSQDQYLKEALESVLNQSFEIVNNRKNGLSNVLKMYVK